MRRRAGRTVAVITLALAGLALAGCAGGSDEDSAGGGRMAPPVAGPAPADPNEGSEDSGGEPGAAPAPRVQIRERAVVYTAAVTVEVDDVSATLRQAESLIASVDGLIANEQTDNTVERPEPDGTVRRQIGSATLVVRVPPAAFGRVLTALGEYGTVLQQTRGATDVTEEVVDVASRVKSAQASVARIRELMDDANALADVVLLESELTRRQAELESLQARQATLANQVDLATITATLVLADTAQADEDEADLGFVSGLKAGWDGLVAATLVVLTVTGALLPFAVVIALVGIPLFVVLRRNRRLRPAAPVPAMAGPPAAPPPAPERPA